MNRGSGGEVAPDFARFVLRLAFFGGVVRPKNTPHDHPGEVALSQRPLQGCPILDTRAPGVITVP